MIKHSANGGRMSFAAPQCSITTPPPGPIAQTPNRDSHRILCVKTTTALRHNATHIHESHERQIAETHMATTLTGKDRSCSTKKKTNVKPNKFPSHDQQNPHMQVYFNPTISSSPSQNAKIDIPNPYPQRAKSPQMAEMLHEISQKGQNN